MGVERGRAGRPGLKVGVCGEHGGDPKSIAFFHEVGLDYVSCSPFRVPVARLAAAQAALPSVAPSRKATSGPKAGAKRKAKRTTTPAARTKRPARRAAKKKPRRKAK